MKGKIICLMLISSILMTGCFSYKDINRILFVTGLLIDIDNEENIILYTETFVATRSSGERMGNEERIVFKQKAKTLQQAGRNINMCTSFRLNYTQNKAIIFTERAAKYGIDNFLDVLYRDRQTLLRQFIFIYPGDPEEILKVELKEEPFLGIFLSELVLNQRVTSKGVQRRLDEYLNNRLMGSTVDLLNTIDIEDSHPEERVCISGAAIMKDDKMVGNLNIVESKMYNFLKGTSKAGGIDVQNPEHKENFVTLSILSSRTKSSLEYDGSKVRVKRNIVLRTTFGEARGSVHLTSDSERSMIIKSVEDNVKNECLTLFNKYKEKGIDLLNVQKDFDRKYPNANIDDIVNMIELDVNVQVHLEGSTDSTDFK